jgi:large subunit ribosomal protein L18
MPGHVQLQRRRREGVTDFRSRAKAVTSRSTLLVVRVSDKNVTAQFVSPKVEGDKVLSSAHSRQLLKLGWHGSLKSTPACYLLGMLAGKNALKNGVKDAILYNGVAPFIAGARVAALVKGVIDAGVSVPMGEGVVPSDDRLSGKTIAEYASSLAKEDKALYQARFSALLKRGFKPEEYPANFEKAKAAIGGAGK